VNTSGGLKFSSGGPRFSGGGPRFSSGGPRFSGGGPRFSSGGPRFSSGGPKFSGVSQRCGRGKDSRRSENLRDSINLNRSVPNPAVSGGANRDAKSPVKKMNAEMKNAEGSRT